ncbi:MAG: mechanosensitive ion channel [Planctomycetota bacterium]|nr:mechanosensitive ion channel [Planctomycetota bacterium]
MKAKMFLKYLILKKRRLFILLLCLGACFTWMGLPIDVRAQTIGKKAGEIRLEELDITVKSEDVENARIKAGEIKTNDDKLIAEIELSIANIEKDAEATAVCLEKLQQEKKGWQAEKANPKYAGLLEKELGVIRERANISGEQIDTYTNQIIALQDRKKAYADQVVLLASILKLEETLLATPYDQITMIRKETAIAKNYITTAEASLKEKETVASFFTKELEEVKVRTSDEEQILAKDLELLRAEIKGNGFIAKAQEKINSILQGEKAVNNQRVAIFRTRLETAKIRYDEAQQALKNAELNASFLSEKVNRLEEKQRDGELKKKRDEVEVAKKAEEITEKAAEASRIEVEKALQEAVKKGEKVAQEQLITTSPEKKRVLELEAEVHKQVGLVAKRKDVLIAEGTQRYKDFTEYKKSEADSELLLNGKGTLREIDHSLKKIELEIKQILETTTVLESLITSLKAEKKFVSDNLENAYGEILRIGKEAASFTDKELSRQAKEYAHQIAEAIEEQIKLISARLESVNERLEIKKNALALAYRTQERLITLRAANIWTRVESDISTQTLIIVYKDFVGSYVQLDIFFGLIQDNIRNFVSYLSENKHTLGFWLRWCSLIAILAVFYFSRQFIRWWCIDKIQALDKATNLSYYRARLLPSLLITLQKSINAIWLPILSAAIFSIFNIEALWITATIYVLIFLAIYKILRCFLIESFGQEKGDKKLFVSLAYVSSKHLYKALRIILLFSFVSLSIIVVLSVFEYKEDVIDLLWFVYRLGMVILLLWIATQKAFILKLLPSAESRLGKVIHRIIKIIYPIFIAFVVALFAIRGLGYQVLTYLLLKTCIKSFIIAFIAFGVWKYLHYRLNYVREIRLKRGNIKKGTPEEKRFYAVTATYYNLFKYVISIVAGIIIVRVWVRTFYDAVDSPAAPYLVQKIFRQIGTIWGDINNGLQYHFVLEGGRYTTPLKIIIALVVLFASFFFARYIKTLLEGKVFHKFHLERGARHTLSTLIRYFIVGIAALVGLNLAGIPLRSLAFFAGAFGIGIGFGMQNIISNFVSGIILLFERPIRVGDVVSLEDGTLGTVDKFSVRSTIITTPDGITLRVPNSKFIESRITNLSHPTPQVRGCVKAKVVYGSNTTLVKNCLLEVAKQNSNVRAYPEPIVRFAEFGPTALVFELYFWSDDPEKRWFTMSELNFAIDEAFQKNNILLHP